MIVTVVGVVPGCTTAVAVMVTLYNDVPALPMSGSRMFTGMGAVPLLVSVTDMPVKAVPVAGSVALMPPLAQFPFVNGVPWKIGAAELTLPESESPELEP